jgi:cytoskeleton protein RodZ
MSGVGTILRETRSRRAIELSEVEAATRIRLRYLRAIENEEWDVLPGGVYTRGFIRTYASFLGLDGERLVEDYRESVERWHRGPAEPSRSPSPSVSGDAPRRFQVPLAGLVVLAVIAVAVLAVVAIPGGSRDEASPEAPNAVPDHSAQAKQQPQSQQSPAAGVSVQLAARAEVWVCLLDARGRPIVDGQILQAGAEEGPFRSGSFTLSFGNGEVTMLIDGREADIAATASPIGYAIDSSGTLTELDEAERPTCA